MRSSWGSNYNVGMRHIGVYSRERELLAIEEIVVLRGKEKNENGTAKYLGSEDSECFIERLEELQIQLSLRVSEEEEEER